ncbi:MAG: response regulator [Bacteroidetes bacterium]|nr:response regulator [Bacteroidota bacterium]
METKIKESGVLLVVEDNKGDQKILMEAFAALGINNEIVIVDDGAEAIEYLKTCDMQPILILCDMNMPKKDGLQLRQEIFDDKKLRMKCIPFIFMTSDDSQGNIEKAFEYAVQGYFEKAKDFDGAVELLSIIIKYWKTSKLPNDKFRLLKETAIQ